MSSEWPTAPRGTAKHPIALVVVTAKDLAKSREFYSTVFAWQLDTVSPDLVGGMAPGGQMIALRSNTPDGFPGMVPYIHTADVEATLQQCVQKGCTIERAPWSIPGVGQLARFKEPGGTIYGLTNSMPPGGLAHVPMPLGSNPKPPESALCSIEMYAADGPAAARFFSEMFSWGTLPTMPQYIAFDPGGGVGGVFQSHTRTETAVPYIYAANVEDKLAKLEAAGGKRLCDPMRLPDSPGCFGYFKDPSGTNMGLMGL
jgi:predicted enzyme related to lactoylglutathione lyase